MKDIEEIAKIIGRDVISKRTGTGSSGVSNAVSFGKFPPSWYLIMKSLGHENGVEIPESMFNWREPVVSEAVQ